MLAVFRLNRDGLVLQQASELSSNFHGRLCNDCEVEVAMGPVSLLCCLYPDKVAKRPSRGGLQTACSTSLCEVCPGQRYSCHHQTLPEAEPPPCGMISVLPAIAGQEQAASVPFPLAFSQHLC